MRYVIENTEAFRILAERARAREVAHATAFAAGELSRAVHTPGRKVGTLAALSAFVVAGLALRVLLPAGARVEVAAGLLVLGMLAVPVVLLGEIMLSHAPSSRHSQP
jgi:hypothetical protein